MTNWLARAKHAFSNKGQGCTAKTDETPLLSVLSVPPGAVYQLPDRLLSVSSVGVWAVFENTQLASDLNELAMKVCDRHGDGEQAREYHGHHFKCPACIAAGQGHGLRCGTGAALWSAYSEKA